MLTKPKNRDISAILAFTGVVLPICGLHKFYLGQPLWGLLYILLSWTPIPHIASAIEGIWYLAQDQEEFDRNFNPNLESAASRPIAPPQVSEIADAMRQLDHLRQDGLISEYEFEQKRRKLLDRII